MRRRASPLCPVTESVRDKWKSAIGGNASLLKSKGILDSAMEAAGERLAGEGKTPLYFAIDGKLAV